MNEHEETFCWRALTLPRLRNNRRKSLLRSRLLSRRLRRRLRRRGCARLLELGAQRAHAALAAFVEKPRERREEAVPQGRARELAERRERPAEAGSAPQ